jgi:hypothetical protein
MNSYQNSLLPGCEEYMNVYLTPQFFFHYIEIIRRKLVSGN